MKPHLLRSVFSALFATIKKNRVKFKRGRSGILIEKKKKTQRIIRKRKLNEKCVKVKENY